MRNPTLEEACIQIRTCEEEIQNRINEHNNRIAHTLQLEYRDFIELKEQFYEKPETDETINYLLDTLDEVFRVLKRNGIDVTRKF